MSKGWECPTCGAVYAPWVPKCSTCPGVTGSAAGGTFVIDTTKECQHSWATDTRGTFCVHCKKLAWRSEWHGGTEYLTGS